MACKRSAVRSRLSPPIDNPKQSSNIQRTGVTAGFLLPFVSIMGGRAITEINAPDALAVRRRIKCRGALDNPKNGDYPVAQCIN